LKLHIPVGHILYRSLCLFLYLWLNDHRLLISKLVLHRVKLKIREELRRHLLLTRIDFLFQFLALPVVKVKARVLALDYGLQLFSHFFPALDRNHHLLLMVLEVRLDFLVDFFPGCTLIDKAQD
jgi:hypothetical protein